MACARLGPKIIQTAKVTTASPITTGTNHSVMRSTKACTGSFPPCASATMLIMRDKTVAEPVARTSITMAPVPFTVPPVSGSPTALATGKASPVSMDSSTVDWPVATTPSTAMRSPGRICTRSPAIRAEIGTSSGSGDSRRAVRGCSATSRAIAAPARPRARASRLRPIRISVTITAAASKYTARLPSGIMAGQKTTKVE